MPPVVTQTLIALGLAPKETVVLLLLLEQGPTLASSIAKKAKLNRTTTYGILKELLEKGLVSSTKKEGATRYQSIAPKLLPAYIRRRSDALVDAEKQLTEAIPQIELLRAKGRGLPKVQFFEGKRGVEQAYEDTLENNQNKTLQNIVDIDAVHTKFDKTFVDYYLKKRTRLGIQDTYITPDTPLARTYTEGVVHYIPAEFSMETEICLYDNKVGIFSYGSENPVALIIEDETIAHTMKQLFRYIASTTQP